VPGKPPGPIVLGVIEVLEREGEATMAEIAKALGRSRFDCSQVVSRMRKPTKMLPKRLYIVRWVYTDDSGGRPYPRAVMALGDKRDAPKPKPKTHAQIRVEYRARERHRVNSVWQWAAPRRLRQAQRQGEQG
jgi:hypothetical protein